MTQRSPGEFDFLEKLKFLEKQAQNTERKRKEKLKEKLEALNQAIDWELLEVCGYTGERNFEAPVPVSMLSLVPLKEVRPISPFHSIFFQFPKLGSFVHLLFWASDTTPTVLNHLLRVCKEQDYPINLDLKYLSLSGKYRSLMHYLSLQLPIGEYVETLALESKRRTKSKDHLAPFSYEREGLSVEKVMLILLENGVPPNGQRVAFARYSTKLWKMAEKHGYIWNREDMLSIGEIAKPHYSIKTRRERMSMLLKKGVSIDEKFELQGEDGYPYLLYLLKPQVNCPTILLNDLIKRGADIHYQSQRGQNAWHHFCESLRLFRNWNQSQNEIPRLTWLRLLKPMIFLKNHQVDINAKNHDGQTPLHLLAQICKAKDVAKVLIVLGADPTILNHQGKRAEDIAMEAGHHDTSEMIYAMRCMKENLRLQNKIPNVSIHDFNQSNKSCSRL